MIFKIKIHQISDQNLELVFQDCFNDLAMQEAERVVKAHMKATAQMMDEIFNEIKNGNIF